MPIEVELPDGNIVEFPDGTDNATMERALSQYAAKPARPDFSDVTTQVTQTGGARPKGQRPMYRQDEVPGFGGPRREFLESAIHGAMSPLHGAAELVQTGLTNAAEFAAEKAPSTITRSLAAMARPALESDRRALQQREADYQARKGGTASTVGQAVGGVAPFVVGAPARAGTALMSKLAPTGSGLVRRGVAASATGGAAGAGAGLIDPVTGDGDYATQKATQAAVGGIGGAALGPAGEFAPGVARRTFNALTGRTPPRLPMAERRAGEILRREAGDAPLPVSPSAVPGVSRTLGEETLNPGVMALENNVRASNRAAFDAIDDANNVARVQSLQQIAGTDAEMAAALEARNRISGEARDAAMAGPDIDLSQTLRSLDELIDAQAGRPAIQSGLRDVRNLIAQNAQMPETVYDQGGLMVQEGPPGALVNPQTVDNIRMTIGDMLSGKYGGDTSKALAGSRQLIQARDALVDEATAQAPRFGEYINAFRAQSRPINRMEIGRELLDSGSAGIRDPMGNQRLMPGTFAKAEDLDAIAARATGFSKAKASEILTPQDIGSIQAIMDDLRRVAKRGQSATAGSQTFERLSVGERIGQRTALRAIPVVRDAVEYFESKMDDAMREKLAYLIANPKEARRVLDALDANSRKTLNNALAVLTAGTATAQAASEE